MMATTATTATTSQSRAAGAVLTAAAANAEGRPHSRSPPALPLPSGRQSQSQKALAEALAGVAAALAAQLLTYPVDVHKTRQQASSVHGGSSGEDVDGGEDENDESEDDGEGGGERRTVLDSDSEPTPSSSPPPRPSVFAGLQTKVLHTAASTFCYFYLYSSLLSLYRARTATAPRTRTRTNTLENSTGGSGERATTTSNDSKVSTAAHLALSALAAMINTLLTLPLDGISSRQQVRDGGNEKKAAAVNGTSSTTQHHRPPTHPPVSYWSRISDLWRGLVPSLILCVNPAINYTVYDSLKDRWLQRQQQQQQQQQQQRSAHRKPQLTALQAFALGVIAKFAATVVTYPLIRAKVLLMVGTIGSNHNNSRADIDPTASSSNSSSSLLRCLADDYRQNGLVGGWYRGCTLQLAHTLLKSALLMAIKERVTSTVREAVAVAAGSGSRRSSAESKQHAAGLTS